MPEKKPENNILTPAYIQHPTRLPPGIVGPPVLSPQIDRKSGVFSPFDVNRARNEERFLYLHPGGNPLSPLGHQSQNTPAYSSPRLQGQHSCRK